MRSELKWWRDISSQEKQELMRKNNIKTMTFEKICELYNMLNKC